MNVIGIARFTLIGRGRSGLKDEKNTNWLRDHFEQVKNLLGLSQPQQCSNTCHNRQPQNLTEIVDQKENIGRH